MALVLGLAAAPAWAQDQAASDAASTPDQVIVVTGTRIDRPDLAATSPVASLDADAIKQVNTVTVEQILTTNPQFSPAFTGASNNPGDGSATLDLRGLAPKRTLVLLNGKRLPVYDTTGAVDVNQIPTALLKRVDVLSGGASAVYGSDAIAGVVNFVLDDKFTGLKLEAGSQITGQGDGGMYDASLTGGIKLGDRGHFIVSANYAKREGVKYGDRDFSNTVLCSDDLVSFCGSSNTKPTAFDIPGAGRQQITPSGALTSDVVGYNYNPVNYAQIPLERYGFNALWNYDITDGVEFYGWGSYQHAKVVTTLAPTATAGFFFNIDPTNPFLTSAERAAFFDTTANPDLVINDGSDVASDPTARAGTSVIGIRRRVTETGGRIEEHTSKTWQILGGLRGDFANGLHWDVSAQYAEVKKHELLRNDLSYTALQQALDVVNGPNGPQCHDPSGGCVPLNLFTVRELTQRELAFVLRDAVQDNKTTQFVAEASVSGDLGFLTSPLASKPAAFSIGGDYRRETASTLVDANYASGDLIYYGQGSNVVGKYDVKEAYAELKLPLIQDRPLFQSLTFETGYRYSKYSTAGGVSAYKFGGDWVPVEGIRVRGNYQRAVRAPNVYELFSPRVSGTGALGTDPCAGANVSPTNAAICIAQGAPASSIGSIPQPIAGQINAFYGGNRNLQAEKSDTYTIGVVLTPPQIRNLALSVDFYSIKIGNAIEYAPSSVVINQCYNVEKSATGPTCQSIVRNSLDGSLSGPITVGVPTLYDNVAALKTRGIDVDLSYRGKIGSDLHYRFNFSGTYVIAHTLEVGGVVSQCAGKFGADCDTPLPKWKHVASLGFGSDKVEFSTRWRLVGAVNQDVSTDILRSHIGAVSYFDETVTFDVNDKMSFTLGVLNVFDKKPPIVGDTSGATSVAGSTFPTVYDVLGRSVFARISAKF